ncbi:hypothetical protein [Streptomyces canus]
MTKLQVMGEREMKEELGKGGLTNAPKSSARPGRRSSSATCSPSPT